MNVLLTCAGRRNYLVQYFREAVAGSGRVLAADAAATAPALAEADQSFTVPPVTATDYVDTLVAICREQEVGLLISLNDLELPRLARERDRFRAVGTAVAVSSPEVVETCFDKWATARFLEGIGLAGPRTFISLDEASAALARGELAFPLVLKPRWGSASIGVEQIDDSSELACAYSLLRQRLQRSILANVSHADLDRSILIQERLTGIEYGMDVVNDLDGNHVATFLRKKLGMRAGETDRAVSCRDTRLEEVGRIIGTRLRHVGNLDCDVFVDQDRVRVLELNPRFGGGYPFSHAAGADLPAALIAWAKGIAPRKEWLRIRPGVTAAKCDRLVIMNAGETAP